MQTSPDILQDTANKGAEFYDGMTSFHRQSLQLRRLLHCMNRNLEQQEEDDQQEEAKPFSIPILREQMSVAQNLLYELEQLSHHLYNTYYVSHEEDYTGLSTHVQPEEEIYLDDEGWNQIQDVMLYLRTNVQVACQNNEYLIQTFSQEEREEDDKIRNLVQRVYFDDLPKKEDDEYMQEFSSDEESEEGANIQPVAMKIDKPMPKKTPEQIQQEQEEILQEEISQMADQLKASSLNIKSTIASQNQDLQEMETMAQENLDKTKDVTEKVETENRKGWRRAMGKWITFFFILGTWVFCFLTIRVVPKRKNACLFFCDDYDSHDDGGYFEPEYSKHHKHEPREKEPANKRVDPKYSYCEASNDGSKQCTAPSDEYLHEEKMKSMEDMYDEDAEDVAYMLAEERREQRFEKKLQDAEKEDDYVATKRVRDGWDQETEERARDDDAEEQYYDDDDDIQDDYYNYASNTEDTEEIVKQEEMKSQQNDEAINEDAHCDRNDLVRSIHTGDVEEITQFITFCPDLVSSRDVNGWEPLHEAIRTGKHDVVATLISQGRVDVNAQIGRTGQGGSALWMAEQIFPEDGHPVRKLLMEFGAVSIHPTQIREDRAGRDEL